MTVSSLPDWYHRVNWSWLGRHFLFWAAYFLLVPFQTNLYGLTAGYNPTVALQLLPFILFCFYTALYGVLPCLLAGKLLTCGIRFVSWCFGVWVGNYLYLYYVLLPINTGKSTLHSIDAGSGSTPSLVPILVQLSIAGIGVSLKLWRHWYRKERNNQQLRQETTRAELRLLKAQIHPHFLFNTLNNLYALTLRQSAHAPEVVLKLAALMHYMLDECNASQIPLQNEIQAIESYIELEKLRYGNRLQVTMQVTGDLSGKTSPPLLLIPFVENAFKHGSSRQTSQVYINIVAQVLDQMLVFTVTNSRDDVPPPVTRFDGIGLLNARKRLSLLFPNQHTLLIHPEKDRYEVELTIPLQRVASPSKQFHSVPEL